MSKDYFNTQIPPELYFLCLEDSLIPSAVYPAQGVLLTLQDSRTGMCVGAKGPIRQAWPSLLIRKEVLFSPFEVTRGSPCTMNPLRSPLPSHSSIAGSCCVCSDVGLNISILEAAKNPSKAEVQVPSIGNLPSLHQGRQRRGWKIPVLPVSLMALTG